MINITFYLKNADSDALIEMPQIGPDVDEDLVDCPRKKLGNEDYLVSEVTVYETALGVDAMKFTVPFKDTFIEETFGVPSEGAIAKVFPFTESEKLVSIGGYQTFSGIGSVSLYSFNQDCVKREAELAVI